MLISIPSVEDSTLAPVGCGTLFGRTLMGSVDGPFRCGNYPPWENSHCRTWKNLMVGMRSVPFGMAYFQARTVSFREGKPLENNLFFVL